MMCPGCTQGPHVFLDCKFPHSCTCQHKVVKKGLPAGNSKEPSTGSFTAQEHIANAADRLDA